MNIENIRDELGELLKDSSELWNSSGSHEVAEYMFYKIERLYGKMDNETN